MIDYEMYEGRGPNVRGCVSCGPQAMHYGGLAYPLTYDDACTQARALLARLSPIWGTKSCAEIAAHISGDCSLFVSPSEIRHALAPGTCGDTGGGGGGGGSSTMIVLGLVGIAAVGGLAILLAKKKG